MHGGQNGCRLEEFLCARERRGEARHAAGLCGLADPGSLRDLLRALAAAALGRELGGASADLAEVLLVWRHGGDGGALGRLQLGAQGIEPVVAQLAQCLGFDPVTERGKLHPCALYSRPARSDRGACASICCMTHAAVIAPREAQLVGQVLHDVIRVDREGAVVTLTIDHPPANAVNGDVVNGLAEGLADCGGRRDRAARWSSPAAGPKFFSAGADISGFGAGADAIGKATDLTFDIEASRLPVIAAVNGIAFGGGCELTLACDIRLASRTARFGQPEIKLGIIPGWGGTQRLPRLIGRARATELLLTGDPIDAERALALGLVAEVVEPDDLPAAARRWAELLASRAPLALAATKRAMHAGGSFPSTTRSRRSGASSSRCSAATTPQEGISAFMQKRQPEWKGR